MPPPLLHICSFVDSYPFLLTRSIMSFAMMPTVRMPIAMNPKVSPGSWTATLSLLSTGFYVAETASTELASVEDATAGSTSGPLSSRGVVCMVTFLGVARQFLSGFHSTT